MHSASHTHRACSGTGCLLNPQTLRANPFWSEPVVHRLCTTIGSASVSIQTLSCMKNRHSWEVPFACLQAYMSKLHKGTWHAPCHDGPMPQPSKLNS